MVMNKSSFQNKEYKWGFPKGHIKENENPLICAKREILEETGLNLPLCVFNKEINIYNSLYYIIHLKQDLNKFNFKDKYEIEKVNWIPIKKFKDIIYNRDIRKFLENYDINVITNQLNNNKNERVFSIINNNKIYLD